MGNETLNVDCTSGFDKYVRFSKNLGLRYYHVEYDKKSHFRLSGHLQLIIKCRAFSMKRNGRFFFLSFYLTLVQSFIPRLDILNLECPGISVMEYLKPFIRNKRVAINCQNVRIPLPNPRNLKEKAISINDVELD